MGLIEPTHRYLEFLWALNRSPNTVESYCRHLGLFFTFLEQLGRRWDEVSPDDLVEFVVWLRNPAKSVNVVSLRGQSTRTERTINTILSCLNSFYRYHVNRGAPIKNPIIMEQVPDRFSRFKPFLVHVSRGRTLRRTLALKEPRKRVKTLREDAFNGFLSAINNLQFLCCIWLMYQGGLRSGEVLGLLIQDVDFPRSGVWIRRREKLENGALAKRMHEGEERFVDLSPQLMQLLDKLVMNHSFDTDHLFVVMKRDAVNRDGICTYGRPLTRDALKAMFRYYSGKANQHVHAHMLRHTHATELIKAGWDASLVQHRLGHRQVQTTLNLYVHIDQDFLTTQWRKYQEGKHSAETREVQGPSDAHGQPKRRT